MLELTPELVIDLYPFPVALKTAPTLCRPITARDIAVMGDAFTDLEGTTQRVEIGRWLCKGVQGELWTCSEKSMGEREIFLGTYVDSEGFTLYRMRHPSPVHATVLTEPFTLDVRGKKWSGQEDGGVITWNGETGEALLMRVITRGIFDATYTWEGPQTHDTI